MQPRNFTPIDELIKFYKNSLTSSFSKEAEPVSHTAIEYQQVVEHEPHQEVQELVQSRQETVKLPTDLKEMGVEAQNEASFQKKETIQLPLDDQKIVEGLHQPITSSWRWLAELALYILKQAHLTLKKVHGHIMRVAYK